MQKPVVIDFETEAIEPRPYYPPRPVGVAIWDLDRKPYYVGWGHEGKAGAPVPAKVQYVLKKYWRSGRPLLFHNAKFDLAVAERWLGLPLPRWDLVHDTMFLLFLVDPYADTFSLKPSSERYLNMPPEEQDRVRDWLVDHGVIHKNQKPGAFISKAPANVVAPYAIGDVVRTERLFSKLFPQLDERMRKAYDRERQLMPILMENEKSGIRVDVSRLARDLEVYEKALLDADDRLRKALKAPGLNLDADMDVARALKASGMVTAFAKTKTGRDSTSKKNLRPDMFQDKNVGVVLQYRNKLQTLLANSMRPWLEQAGKVGRIFTDWNQVRQPGAKTEKGTKTGRLSCSRFMNIAKVLEPFDVPFPELPLVRRYLIPDASGVWGHRDYNQQEFRILAHFEDGGILSSYKMNPRVDYHTTMAQRIKEVTGQELSRRSVKILNFGILYGMGKGKLAEALSVPVTVADQLRRAVKSAAPDVDALDQELKKRGRDGRYIRTWGGRIYKVEPPKEIKEGPRKGEIQTFEYKLLNYLIQGSAADCTKAALIQYDALRKEGRLLVTVHDEINISMPKKAAQREMELLRQAMESIEFDVPMLTDAKMGPSWGELE